MQRAVLNAVGQLALQECAPPVCPSDGLLMQVAACAVCATDVKIFNHGHHLVRLPRVLGHELAGTIAAVGEQWQGQYKPGQRIAVCAVINCMECLYCQRGIPSMCEHLEAFGYHYDGGYAEQMVIPAKAIRCGGVNLLPDTLAFDEASIAELLACCINGQRLSGFALGQNVLIIGAGPVGILQAKLARHHGALRLALTDVDPQRLAEAVSITSAQHTQALSMAPPAEFIARANEFTDGRGFDQVMVCCGVAEAQQLALGCVAKCGCINFFGGLPAGNGPVALDTNIIHYRQCRVAGTHGSSALENRLALEMIGAGLIDVAPLITRRIHLDALEAALKPGPQNRNQLKTVVTYS